MRQQLLFLLVSLAGLFVPATAWSQLELRVSVKLLYADMDRPGTGLNCQGRGAAVGTDEDICDKMQYASAVMERFGRGYRFRLVEIVHLNPNPVLPPDMSMSCGPDEVLIRHQGPAPTLTTNRGQLDTLAKGDPDGYAFDLHAFNIYVIDICGGGGAGTRTRNDAELGVIILGQNQQGGQVRWIHELGHALNLCHTQGHPRNADPTMQTGACWFRCRNERNVLEDGACNRADPDFLLGDDCLDDTLVDHSSCDGVDQIAQNGFGRNYKDLDPDERAQVLDVLYNVMSYHQDNDASFSLDVLCDPWVEVSTGVVPPPEKACRHRFTPDQLDFITDRSNGLFQLGLDAGGDITQLIVNGLTHFVDSKRDGLPGDGSLNAPFDTLDQALDAADANSAVENVVLLREGFYSTSRATIEDRVTLRASRGRVVIGRQ